MKDQKPDFFDVSVMDMKTNHTDISGAPWMSINHLSRLEVVTCHIFAFSSTTLRSAKLCLFPTDLSGFKRSKKRMYKLRV